MKKDRAPRTLPPTLQARIATLSATEREVLEWVEQGKRNSEIASIVGRSQRTIDGHVAAILAKLGVETRGAAACALREAEANHCPNGGPVKLPRGRRRK